MQRALPIIAIVLLVCTCFSCGGVAGFVTVGGRQGTFLTTSGTVSIVQLTVVDGDTQVTIVTFLNSGLAFTNNFCGNVVDRFPINGFVTVNFTPATTCATIISIVN